MAAVEESPIASGGNNSLKKIFDINYFLFLTQQTQTPWTYQL
jgi:hypothetical protein